MSKSVDMADQQGSIKDKDGYIFSTDEIQSMIEMEFNKQLKDWRGVITLPVTPMTDTIEPSLFAVPPTEIDVCLYFNKKQSTYTRLNFSVIDFPPPSDLSKAFARDNVVWKRLKTMIERQSYQHNSPVICGSGSLSKKTFNCQCCNQTNNTNRSNKRPDEEYRRTFLSNDGERGERGDGRSKCRRTNAQDALVECNFTFGVRCDKFGYYITLKRYGGNPIHSNHPKYENIPFPPRLLTDEEKKDMQNLHDTRCSNGVASAYAMKKFGRSIPRSKIAYMCGGKDKETLGGDIDVMLSNFEKDENTAHTVLWHVSCGDGKRATDGKSGRGEGGKLATDHKSDMRLVSRVKDFDDKDPIVNDVTTNESMSHVANLAEEERKERNISDKKNLFIAVAWTYKDNVRYFKLYPEVVWCDITSHSNDKKYHLMTFSVKSGTNKQLVFLRVWIPNQRRFSFRWVFEHAIESLGLAPYFLSTELFMKDGDPQQHNEIKRVMASYLKNAADAACGWHIIHQGWKRHCPGVKSVPDKEKWIAVGDHIKNWMYSWMRPGYCESEEEYNVSKELLHRYISSPTVYEASGRNDQHISRVKAWVHLVTSSHAPVYLHYLRKDKRSFDTFVASAHEGTNLGLKNHSIAVKANASMSSNAKAMAMQAKMKTDELDDEAFRNVHKCNKLWSVLPTSKHLTPYAEGLIHSIMDRDDMYEARYVGESSLCWEFEVTCKECVEPFLGDDLVKDSPVPRFTRTRYVKIDRKGICKCSCCYYQRVGIPCPHIATIFRLLIPHWKGFLHTDIALRWWSKFAYYGYQIPSHGHLTKLFHELRTNEKQGPTLPLQWIKSLDRMETHVRTVQESAVNRLKNYNKDDVSTLLGGTIDGCTVSTYVPDSLTQEQVLLSQPLTLELVEQVLLSQPLTLELDLPEPALFTESVSDVAGAHNTGAGIRASMIGKFNELMELHAHAKDTELDEDLSQLFQDRINIAKNKIDKKKKLTAREENGNTIAMMVGAQEGGTSRVYNCKGNHSM